jgi:spore coat protein CotH
MRGKALRAGIQFVVALLLFGGGERAFAADPLFDQTRLHDVRLYVAPEDWQTLRENYLSDDYYVANVSLDGLVIRTVGIRSRGSGSRSGQKPALKIDMNEYVDQDYHGYKELILRNVVQDPSFLRERLAFMVFEGMGIAAPQNAFCRLYVNDEYFGLYEVEEPVGKPFLKERLGEDKGNLFDYEYTSPYDLSFRSDDPHAYIPYPFKPETNEDDLDASGLVDFIRAVNGAPDERFVRDMGAWLDLPKFLTYVAVENVLAATDGFLGKEGMNNFFLYQYDKQRRFTFIPWDKDTILAHPSFPIMGGVETNVLTRRLLRDPAMQQIYARALYETATRFVNQRYLIPRLETAYQQVREAALADPNKPYTNEQFEDAVGGLRGVILAREADVVAQTGVVASP